MKTPSSELKKRAKQTLKGKYGLCVGMFFIIYAVIMVIAMVYMGIMFALELSSVPYEADITFAGIILRCLVFVGYLLGISLTVGLLTPGMTKAYLNLCTEKEAKLSDLLYAVQNKPLKFIGLYLITAFAAMAWGIPYFVVLMVSVLTEFIPVMIVLLILTYLLYLIGIIMTALYLSQSVFIMLESEDKRVFACLKESIRMIKGHKGSLFYLYISFFGMLVLGYCSMGIGFLWIFPYIQCAAIHFYLELKKETGKTEPEVVNTYSADYYSQWEEKNL